MLPPRRTSKSSEDENEFTAVQVIVREALARTGVSDIEQTAVITTATEDPSATAALELSPLIAEVRAFSIRLPVMKLMVDANPEDPVNFEPES